MPMMSEDRIRRLLDTFVYAADFAPCDCRGPCVPSCVMGGAMMSAQADVLRMILGIPTTRLTMAEQMMQDEPTQKAVSDWIARGRK